jgi:hypothetical protein
VVSQPDCLVKGLQRISVLSSLDAKKVRGAPRSQDEVIVRNGRRTGLHHVSFEIDTADFGHQEIHVGKGTQDAPDGIDDLLGLELGGRHLVEQGKKGVIVVAID